MSINLFIHLKSISFNDELHNFSHEFEDSFKFQVGLCFEKTLKTDLEWVHSIPNYPNPMTAVVTTLNTIRQRYISSNVMVCLFYVPFYYALQIVLPFNQIYRSKSNMGV